VVWAHDVLVSRPLDLIVSHIEIYILCLIHSKEGIFIKKIQIIQAKIIWKIWFLFALKFFENSKEKSRKIIKKN